MTRAQAFVEYIDQSVSAARPTLQSSVYINDFYRRRREGVCAFPALHGLEKTMNSLNILSARVIGQTSSKASRSRSQSNATQSLLSTESSPNRGADGDRRKETSREAVEKGANNIQQDAVSDVVDEKKPLLEDTKEGQEASFKRYRLQLVAKRLVDALTESLRWVLSTLAAPGVYVVTCFYDNHGRFSPIMPVRRMSRILPRRRGGNSTAQAVGLSATSKVTSSKGPQHPQARSGTRPHATLASRNSGSTNPSSSGTSEDETERRRRRKRDGPPMHTRSMSSASTSTEEITPSRRSIRIKLHDEDVQRKRKQKKTQSHSKNKNSDATTGPEESPTVTAATLKSPTSPTSSLGMSKYPRSPAPPRPLIPRRQPSYSTPITPSSSSQLPQKTLVIDLDETLIHSLAKGGRMSSGHMVEVKLNSPVGFGGTTLGPQHPILYYVHKRPYCDEFLRKVCNWYKLVVFTASVQEYADPVIDWLEQERSFFAGRYYRQHCTFRNGAYIKDLSSVEPDLSRVMILDNSPMSYIFHEGTNIRSSFRPCANAETSAIDNAIPIEGWINDPTDNDLLHLIPVLEGLQYVTDVRALLALRRGETET